MMMRNALPVAPTVIVSGGGSSAGVASGCVPKPKTCDG